MHPNKLEIIAPPDEPTITTRRIVRAPRTLVFDAFTKPEHVQKWMGPKELTWTKCETDLRVGGSYHWVHRAPDGMEYSFSGAFKEITRPEKIVRTFIFDLMPQFVAIETLTLTEEDGLTTIHTLTVHDTIEARDGHLGSGQMEIGVTEGYERLDELLLAQVQEAESMLPFTISREFKAPRDLLWTAYTDPQHTMKWFGPPGTEVLRCDMDLRVGGSYHYGLRMPDGHEMWGKQKYLEVVQGERLVFLQSFSDATGADARHPAAPTWPLEMLATTTFEALDDGRSRLTVQWVPYSSTAEEKLTFDQAREGMSGGFNNTFNQLEAYLASL